MDVVLTKKWFFEKNEYLLHSSVNKTFDELLRMTTEEFRQWVINLRNEVVYAWDVLGIPPRTGYTEAQIIEQFNEMWYYPVWDLLEVDTLTGEKDLIRNTSSLGNAVNQFFPTMLKTRINYSKDPTAGKSIYDFFADDELLETFITYATRHFKRDSFYHHSLHVEADDKTLYPDLPVAMTGYDWIRQFESEGYRNRGKYDYWLAPVKEDFEYTGYAEHLKHCNRLTVNKEEIEALSLLIADHSRSNIDWNRSELYRIRYFAPGQKVFPIGFGNFRVSFCQYAVNFPPLIAKWVYETFTEEWKGEDTVYVWDPSAGWGGRLLGCLGVKDDRHITYLGNDPNTDHNTQNGRTKYHEIHDFYCQNVRKGGLIPVPHNDFEFWQSGSEDMQHIPSFQRYKGKLSLVFTSPPYFAKELYSQDETQSSIKFSEYKTWKEQFLYPTLQTAVHYLRPGGYLVWNIADVLFEKDMLPLEQDSLDIINSFGEMTFIKKYKMGLGSMPGGNRVDAESGLPKTKNFAKTKKGIWTKYEPLYVFRKNA